MSALWPLLQQRRDRLLLGQVGLGGTTGCSCCAVGVGTGWPATLFRSLQRPSLLQPSI